jgi:hypothetical protein
MVAPRRHNRQSLRCAVRLIVFSLLAVIPLSLSLLNGARPQHGRNAITPKKNARRATRCAAVAARQ